MNRATKSLPASATADGQRVANEYDWLMLSDEGGHEHELVVRMETLPSKYLFEPILAMRFGIESSEETLSQLSR